MRWQSCLLKIKSNEIAWSYTRGSPASGKNWTVWSAKPTNHFQRWAETILTPMNWRQSIWCQFWTNLTWRNRPIRLICDHFSTSSFKPYLLNSLTSCFGFNLLIFNFLKKVYQRLKVLIIIALLSISILCIFEKKSVSNIRWGSWIEAGRFRCTVIDWYDRDFRSASRRSIWFLFPLSIPSLFTIKSSILNLREWLPIWLDSSKKLSCFRLYLPPELTDFTFWYLGISFFSLAIGWGSSFCRSFCYFFFILSLIYSSIITLPFFLSFRLMNEVFENSLIPSSSGR